MALLFLTETRFEMEKRKGEWRRREIECLERVMDNGWRSAAVARDAGVSSRPRRSDLGEEQSTGQRGLDREAVFFLSRPYQFN